MLASGRRRSWLVLLLTLHDDNQRSLPWLTDILSQIIHSELDYRLPVTEGLAAFNVLQARKVPSKLLVFPDENHVSRPT